MKHHGGGSHNQHAHPDHKMSARHVKPGRYAERRGQPNYDRLSSFQRQVMKKIANAKRRRRDREVTA